MVHAIPEPAQQPLHVKRTDLISTLQSNLTAEQQARTDADALVLKRRQAAQDAVASLTADEMLNLVLKWYSDLDSIVEMVNEAKESGRLVSQEMKPNDTETALAKYVRILNLATDDTIEVSPTDDLYRLL